MPACLRTGRPHTPSLPLTNYGQHVKN